MGGKAKALMPNQVEAETIKAFIMSVVSPGDFEWVGLRGRHIYLKSIRKMTIEQRGHDLMVIENEVRAMFPHPYEVFLEPVGDMNKLRQRLRGVKV